MTPINEVSESSKRALRAKLALSLPDNPSKQGYSAQRLKEYFSLPIIDAEGKTSVVGEINRVVREMNLALDDTMPKGLSMTPLVNPKTMTLAQKQVAMMYIDNNGTPSKASIDTICGTKVITTSSDNESESANELSDGDYMFVINQ